MRNALHLITSLFILTQTFAQAPEKVFESDSLWRELPDQRTYVSKTYYNANDNTYKAVISAGYIHYLASDWRYQDIGTRLRLDKSDAYYVIDSGLYNVAFANAISKGNWDVAYEVPRPVKEKFRDPGKARPPVTRIRWKVLSYGYFDRQSNRYVILENAKAATPVVFNNTINYPQIFKDIDVRYTCGNVGVKEEIVLSQMARDHLPDPAQHGLSRDSAYVVVAMEFLLTPNNINVFARRPNGKTPIKQGSNFSFDGDDQIDFEDADSTLHFFFPKDYAYAIADSVTDFANRTSLRRYFYSDRGKDYMLVGVPWTWINSAPQGDLIIDPTTSVTTSNDVRLLDGGNYGSGGSLSVSKKAGVNKSRTLVQFIIGASIPSNAIVLNAQMKLWYYNADGSSAWIDRYVQAHQMLVNWDELQATRDNRLAGTPWAAPYAAINGTDAVGTYESILFFTANQYPSWKSWDVTLLTQKWVNGTAANYGVILWEFYEDTDGKKLWFRSSESANSNEWPRLEVTYSTEAATKTVYFLKDHLGSIRATVLDSATAPVIGYDDYDAWGYPLASRTKSIPNAYLQGASKYKFTGKERDDEFGLNLDYFGARYYDWLIGRWISRDPLAEKYPSLGPYNYAANNPIINYDRDGRIIDTIVDAVSIAYDVYDIARTVVQGKEVSRTQYAALGADVAGLLLPGATGLGAAIRTASKVDDVVDVARASEKVTDVVKGTEKIADAGRDLTSAEKGIFEKIDRIKAHLTPKDIQGAVKDLQRNPVIIGGKRFDHLREVQEAQAGLIKQIEKLKRALSDRTLSTKTRKQIEQKLSETSKFLDETEELVPRGGNQQ